MTKKEYIHWMKTRGEPRTWDYKQCVAADELIKKTALRNLAKYLKKLCINNSPVLNEFIITMASLHFGSVETDDMLCAIGAYPKWISDAFKEDQ